MNFSQIFYSWPGKFRTNLVPVDFAYHSYVFRGFAVSSNWVEWQTNWVQFLLSQAISKNLVRISG